MKIISSDANRLVASDKAYGMVIAGAIMVLLGIGLVVFSLAVQQLIVSGFGGLLLLMGAFMILSRKERIVVVDKGAGQLIFKMKSILKKGEYPYALTDILKVQLATEYRTTSSTNTTSGDGGTTTTQTTKLLLVMQNGSTVDIADGQRSMSTMGVYSHVPNQEAGQQIATFIGVPFEELGSPSLGQGVSAVVNAIRGNAEAPSVVAPPQPPSQPAQPVAPPVVVPPQAVAQPIRPPEPASAPTSQPESPEPGDAKPPG